MNRTIRLISQGLMLLITVIFVGVILVYQAPVSAAEGNSGDVQQATEDAQPGTDSNPVGEPEINIPYSLQPQEFAAEAAGDTVVYFVPQDENTSTTILFFYNTTGDALNVDITTYQMNGVEYLSTTIPIPAHGMVRVCGDDVVTSSETWQDVVLVNFTTFSAYGELIIPDGVEVDGYIAWNGGYFYDPLQSVPTLPLRLSTDLYAIYFPIIHKSSETMPLIFRSAV